MKSISSFVKCWGDTDAVALPASKQIIMTQVSDFDFKPFEHTL